MRDKPNICIRPLEYKDIPIIRSWRRLPEWPDRSTSFLSERQSSFGPVLNSMREYILIAEDIAGTPIGLAHISATGLPKGIAQYSVIIPNAKFRKFCVGRDLILFSIGAAFRAFSFMKIFSLIDETKSWLIKMCIKRGFELENDLSFIGIQSCPVGLVVLTTTPDAWMTLWEDELTDRGRHIPWVRKWLLDEVTVSDLCKKTGDEFKNLVSDDWANNHTTVNNGVMPPRKVLA